MADETDPETTLDEAAAGPSTVSSPSGSATQQPLGDLIRYADRKAKVAARQKGPFGGLQVGLWSPPSAKGC